MIPLAKHQNVSNGILGPFPAILWSVWHQNSNYMGIYMGMPLLISHQYINLSSPSGTVVDHWISSMHGCISNMYFMEESIKYISLGYDLELTYQGIAA